IDNAVGDAAPVQLVLWPAVACPWQNAEQVLERQRRSRPVMSLELGQGDKYVGGDHGLRQIQVGEPGGSTSVDLLDRLVVVQIDKGHLVVPQHVPQAAGTYQILHVTPVAGALGDDHLAGSFPAT